jgi:hypothetical protein
MLLYPLVYSITMNNQKLMNEILAPAQRATPTVVRITTENFVIATKPTGTRKFDTDKEMYDWLARPLNAKLWKLGQVDWEKRTIRVEGRPLSL